jgi:hypothetical protein
LRKNWLEKWAKINYRSSTAVGAAASLFFRRMQQKCPTNLFSIHQHIDRRGMAIMQQATKG